MGDSFVMAITARHLVNKHLKKLVSFNVCEYEGLPDAHKEGIAAFLNDDEDCVLGVYKDESEINTPDVIFTEKSIIYFDDKKYNQWYYRDIVSINGDVEANKMDASELYLFLSNNQEVVLKITGGGERFRDIYTVHRFLLKAINTQKGIKGRIKGTLII
jgi:hypothetical protein